MNEYTRTSHQGEVEFAMAGLEVQAVPNSNRTKAVWVFDSSSFFGRREYIEFLTTEKFEEFLSEWDWTPTNKDFV